MTYFADLDVSTIDELPPRRGAVKTRTFSAEKRAGALKRDVERWGGGGRRDGGCRGAEETRAGECGRGGDVGGAGGVSGRAARRRAAPALRRSRARQGPRGGGHQGRGRADRQRCAGGTRSCAALARRQARAHAGVSGPPHHPKSAIRKALSEMRYPESVIRSVILAA